MKTAKKFFTLIICCTLFLSSHNSVFARDISLSITCANGQCLEMSLPSETKIIDLAENVKSQIYQYELTPPIMCYNGNILDPEATLDDYGICDDVQLFCYQALETEKISLLDIGKSLKSITVTPLMKISQLFSLYNNSGIKPTAFFYNGCKLDLDSTICQNMIKSGDSITSCFDDKAEKQSLFCSLKCKVSVNEYKEMTRLSDIRHQKNEVMYRKSYRKEVLSLSNRQNRTPKKRTLPSIVPPTPSEPSTEPLPVFF